MNDLISRQAAIDAVCTHGTELERRGITVLAVANHKQVTVDLLEQLPSAQPERKKGKWKVIYPTHTYKYHCSECAANHKAMYDFCPSCGADMRGEQDE